MFSSKSVAIITGGSKGFGRAIACSFAREFCKTEEGKKSVLVIVSRSIEGLQETKRLVEDISGQITVHIVSGDLADLANLSQLATKVYDAVNPNEFSSAILVNNAGTLGDVSKKISDFVDVDEIHQHLALNVTSPFYLISHFLRVFNSVKKCVVNISTLAAVRPHPTFGLYSTSRAARDMTNKILAVESEEVRVLNYAPGPLKTEMFYDILNNSASSELRKTFQDTIDSGYLLDAETSSNKLVTLLKQDRYKSGDHIDYFDELP